MTFEERKRKAQSILIDFLSIFTAPRGLDDGQLARRIAEVADAFARRMPVKGDYEAAVHAVLKRVMDTHLSNTWPPQAAFVMAMPNREVREFLTQQTYEPTDPIERIGKLMEEGEAVPESTIWGNSASLLPHRHVDRYRNASVMRWMEVYGKDAPSLMRSHYGPVVNEYFPREAAE